MLIQELFKPENKEMLAAYGIELPKKDSAEFANLNDYSHPPENLEFVGFLLELDSEGEVMEELLDMILSYKLTNLAIAIEVPSHLITIKDFEENKLSLKSLLVLSSNLDCSLSFLPPKHPSVDPSYNNEQYTELMKEITQLVLNKPNHSQLIMPITNYQEYLMIEQLLGADNENIKNFKPTDDYVLQNFVPYSTIEEQNQFKAAIKETIINHYGGKENFAKICELIFNGVNQKSKEFLKIHIVNSIEEQKKLIEENNNESSEVNTIESVSTDNTDTKDK